MKISLSDLHLVINGSTIGYCKYSQQVKTDLYVLIYCILYQLIHTVSLHAYCIMIWTKTSFCLMISTYALEWDVKPFCKTKTTPRWDSSQYHLLTWVTLFAFLLQSPTPFATHRIFQLALIELLRFSEITPWCNRHPGEYGKIMKKFFFHLM